MSIGVYVLNARCTYGANLVTVGQQLAGIYHDDLKLDKLGQTGIVFGMR